MSSAAEANSPPRDFSRYLTEQRNPRTMQLDALPLREALRIVNREDAEVAEVVAREIERIAQAVELIVERRRRGEAPADPTTKKCAECLSEVPIAALRCAFCTQPLQTSAGGRSARSA